MFTYSHYVFLYVSKFFWFSCQYLPSDWLERLLWGHLFEVRTKEIVFTKPRLKRSLCLSFLSFCLFMLLCFLPGLKQYAHGTIYLLKVSLKSNQTIIQPFKSCSCSCHHCHCYWVSGFCCGSVI